MVGYSPYPWPHAVAALRLVRPIQRAGLQFIAGQRSDGIDVQSVSQADIVVIQREFPLFWEEYEQVLALARSQGKPLVYEIDDLLLELPDVHPDRAIDYYTPAILPILHAIASADLVTTTTPNLAQYLQRYNPNISILPNYLDDDFWKLHPYSPGESPGGTPDRPPVVIGYMGSDTHLPDIESISQVFLELAARFGEKVRFRFWGCQPPEQVQQLPQTEWLPMQIFDYPKFAEYFLGQEADILIAPLLDSLFNRCKSAVKLLEYSALGVPCVCSRIAPYESLIMQGINGFLASSVEEWQSHLIKLVENSGLRKQIGEQLQATVREQWLLSQHAEEWIETYRHAQLVAQRGDFRQRADQVSFLRNLANQTVLLNHRQNQQINQLQETNQRLQQQLDDVYGSRAWSLIQKLWRLRLALIPAGSRLERGLRLGTTAKRTSRRSGE